MTTRAHPTHHQNYKPARSAVAVVVAILGAFLCAVVIGLDPGGSDFLHVAKSFAMASGAVAFCGGAAFAVWQELRHACTSCPSCGRWIFKSETDYSATYYPCRRCDITWTCPCREAAGG